MPMKSVPTNPTCKCGSRIRLDSDSARASLGGNSSPIYDGFKWIDDDYCDDEYYITGPVEGFLIPLFLFGPFFWALMALNSWIGCYPRKTVVIEGSLAGVLLALWLMLILYVNYG